MPPPHKIAARTPVSLPGELQLRTAIPADRDALVALHSTAHAGPDGCAAYSVGQWQQDLFDRGHPTAGLTDIMVVEDQRSRSLVASLMMVPQTWSYAGISFGVGRVELAATDSRYRGRGLMANLLRDLSRASTARGQLMQALTDTLPSSGELGYHMALTQRAGRGGHTSELAPVPAKGEPFRLREATPADIPVLLEIDSRMRRRTLLSCLRDKDQWRHELAGHSPGSMVRDQVLVIESAAESVGYVVLGYGGIPSFPIPAWLPGLPCPEPVVSVAGFELTAGTSWLEAVPSVLRQVTGSESQGYLLWLGLDHPAYDVLSDLLVRRPQHIGWFLRVPDLKAFLSRIAPVLEQRLVDTSAERFTGELKLHFYTHGLYLRFEEGSITDICSWSQHSRRGSDASLPEQMFLQLLFGHARWDDVAPAFPDCRLQNRPASLLLSKLFPRQPSTIWPLI
jgi:hypothetical protein